MSIRALQLHNYRSIRDLAIQCQPTMVFLGPNNHGKSNVLSALEFALATGARPTIDDLFRFAGEERQLWVELEFHQLTEQEKQLDAATPSRHSRNLTTRPDRRHRGLN